MLLMRIRCTQKIVFYSILHCLLFQLYSVCALYSCSVLFVSISQVIGCEDCLRNDLDFVGRRIKLYSNCSWSYAAVYMCLHSE